MNEQAWQQAKQLFNQVLVHAPEERSAYLSDACADDDDLRLEVESLLVAFYQADQFIETPAVHDVLKLVDSHQYDTVAGRRVGQYEIIRKLGDGGMGAVYLAARADDQYQKQVAIKLIKFGFDNQFIVNRFLSERQILASLDHPNIARLLDGGTAEDGTPYLVMEYIEGAPIDEYCERQRLSISDRLKVFSVVCGAVQFAHSNLVIHRDLKPGNILVTNDGIPKLLDFGIAKLLNPGASAPGYSEAATAVRLMTPEYASPEQARGANVSTATDVYSLGVVLYELLTGQRPHRSKAHDPEGLAREICEKEPDRPSLVSNRPTAAGDQTSSDFALRSSGSILNASAKNNSQSATRNQKLLRGDLDNIVLMALRKEPQRRYESAAHLSADIQRHLDGLPVLARKATFKYRGLKFVRRNRLSVIAATIVLCSLLGGIVATTWQARVAARQARAAALQALKAQQEKAKAQSIIVLLEQMLNNANPSLSSSRKNGRETSMAEMLDEASARLKSTEFANQLELKAELERILGRAYYGQGLYSLAREHTQEYVRLEKGLYGENDPRTLEASTDWAMLLWERGEMTEAEKVLRQILPSLRIGQKNGSITTGVLLGSINIFGCLRRNQGDSREAEAAFREVLTLGSQAPPEFPLGIDHSQLASTLADQGRFDEALQTARDAVIETRQREGAESSILGFTLTVLGGFLSDKGDFTEADAALHDAETIFRKLEQPSTLWLGDNLRNQAISDYRQNKFAEAQSRVDETLKIYREDFGVHYDNYPTALITKGLILTKTGKAKEGEAILREAVKLRTESLPKDHFWVAVANDALGECLTNQKRFTEAEPLLVESYAILNTSLGPRDPRTIEAGQRVVSLYGFWGKPEHAAHYRTTH